jgi:thiosulfate/3-mercaptopyruvate sulfurtransferase
MRHSPAKDSPMSGFARPELIATPEWLAQNVGRPDLRILDLRWRPDGTAAEVFAGGHIPGAVHLDWRTALAVEAAGAEGLLLAAPEHLRAHVSRVGIGDGTTVVAYDDTVGLFAARAWWSLRAYGFDSVRVLDGGFPAWVEGGRPLSHAVTIPEPATFTPRAQIRTRLATADVRALLGAPDVLLVDARGPAEFHGHEGNARRLGHIPGAVNLPASTLHVPGAQHLRDSDELRTMLLKANITRGRRLVCYDGTGVAAAKLAFVLTLLGHDDVAVYDGGWAEWGDRLDLPVDR